MFIRIKKLFKKMPKINIEELNKLRIHNEVLRENNAALRAEIKELVENQRRLETPIDDLRV